MVGTLTAEEAEGLEIKSEVMDAGMSCGLCPKQRIQEKDDYWKRRIGRYRRDIQAGRVFTSKSVERASSIPM